MNKLRIGSDLDGCVNYFMQPYIDYFGVPKNDFEITKNVFNVLRFDREFWVNIPLKHRPDFEATMICTKRVHNKAWTKEWFKRQGFWENVPLYQMYYQKGRKSRMIGNKVDVFIEDSVENWKEINKAGIPCLLMASGWNEDFSLVPKIHSLCYEEIEGSYYDFMKYYFEDVKRL